MAAQPPRTVGELLSIPPVDQLTCRQTRLENAPERISFSYSFEVGVGPLENHRSIHVTFTSDGSLFTLTEQNSFRRDGLLASETAVIFVAPDDSAGGKKVTVELPIEGGANARALPQEITLTSNELAQARRLAAWLWERRCDA
jgi:hypothetical protein